MGKAVLHTAHKGGVRCEKSGREGGEQEELKCWSLLEQLPPFLETQGITEAHPHPKSGLY